MLPKKKFVFSTDSYDKYSVKAQERVRRGSSQQLRIDGPANKKSPVIKTFLKNDQNKEQLCDQVLRVCSSERASSRIESCSQPILIVNPLEGKKNPVWATSRLLPGTDANSPDGIYMVSLRSGPSTDPKVNYTKVNHIF